MRPLAYALTLAIFTIFSLALLMIAEGTFTMIGALQLHDLSWIFASILPIMLGDYIVIQIGPTLPELSSTFMSALEAQKVG